MTDDRKNIKVPEGVFERLKEDKKGHETWASYFERKCLDDE